MYRVIIADDEPLMRAALSTFLEGPPHNYELCGTAANGAEALKLIEQCIPDIVITDLKMPEMDGLELIRQINQRQLSCKVLVVSNYSDFDLVRQALKLGAADYVLKIDIEEKKLLQQLDSIARTIEQDEQSKRRTESRNRYINSHRKIDILRDFFKSSATDITPFTEGKDITWEFADSPCRMFCIFPRQELSTATGWADFNMIQTILSESLEYANLTMEMFSLFPEGIVLLANPADITPEQFCAQLQSILQTYISYPCATIYSSTFVGYAQAKENFLLCSKARNRLFYSDISIFSAECANSQESAVSVDMVSLINSMIEREAAGGWSAVKVFIEDVFNQCKKTYPNPAKLKKHCIYLFQYLMSNPYNRLKDLSGTDPDFEEKINRVQDIDSLISLTLTLLQPFFPSCNMRPELSAALEYIGTHYREKLMLSDIASYVHLNESYLCRLFKEEMNISIVNYINKLRMEKAAQLILANQVPIKNIGYLIGIETPSYFYRLFKAYYNLSPTQYAKSHAVAALKGNSDSSPAVGKAPGENL